MNLNISTNIDFVINRSEKTSAVIATLAAQPQPWVSATKAPAQWVADIEQLDGAMPGTLAQLATAATTAKDIGLAALDERYNTIHARTVQAVGVMRSRALSDSTLRPVVDELSARGGSKSHIEEEGEELLAAWSQEFGEDFIPGPGNTYSAMAELFEGNATLPALRALKSGYRTAVTKNRRAAGNFNTLINRLEDDCVQWYAEATAVFPAGTDNGDLIRGQIPTDYSPAAAAPAAPATPA